MMPEQRSSLTLHYLLRAAILAAFSIYIVRLVQTDHLQYYIAPRMQGYIKCAAVALIVLAVYQAYMAWQQVAGQRRSCDCGHPPAKSLFKNTVVYGLFIVPLTLGFVLPDTLMGSSMAAKKGMSLSSATTNVQQVNRTQPASLAAASVPQPAAAAQDGSLSPLSDAELKALFPSDAYTEDYASLAKKLYSKQLIPIPDGDGFIETLTTLDLFAKPFVGKKIEISGFVYREDQMRQDQFVVGRIAMQCCSADSSPLGVMVEWANGKNYTNDSWVKVTGTLDQTTYNRNDIMMLKAEKVEKIGAPASAYVYPKYQYLLEYK